MVLAYFALGAIGSSSEGHEVKIGEDESISTDDTVEIVSFVNKGKNNNINQTRRIQKGLICLKIENKEPVGVISNIPSGISRIFCWARFLNAKGERIRYLWYLDNKVVASAWQVITSDRFISWCPYRFNYNEQGTGWVEIVNNYGEVLKTIRFTLRESNKTKVRRPKHS